jgi:hypothetical protein
MSRQVPRLLRGYSLDPGFSTRLDTVAVNEVIYRIRWEDPAPGPIGDYFEVIDFDPASNCFYDPVDLNSVEVMRQNGLSPSEGNPKFHQQFVYTIAMQTLEHFEASLGRKVLWSSNIPPPQAKTKKTKDLTPEEAAKKLEEEVDREYVDKLRIYPHALREPNAFYVPDKKAVLFGYFEAAERVQGENVPGGVIFTCLSPDIIAHEVTHAILDSIHPRFLENTNPDVAAFHEAFADIVALLQRFTNTQLIEHQIAKTRGDLSQFSFLGELATQFGNALEFSRGALRGAIGKYDEKKKKWVKYTPDPQLYQTVHEPHSRGGILVATIFDAFLRLYNNNTQDLMRIASNGTGILQPGAIHPDLVKRLAESACNIAEHLLHICIRALDYCPPTDINFGDFLRALITADIDSSPADKSGYRIALIEAFRSWGIFPDRVNTLSIEGLQWAKPDEFLPLEKGILNETTKFLRENIRPIVELSMREGNNRREIYKAFKQIQRKFHGFVFDQREEHADEKSWQGFLRKLGLTDEPVQFTYDPGEGEKPIEINEDTPLLEIHKIRPVYRVGREGNLLEQVIVTLSQTIRIKKGPLKDVRYRGGCSLILNMAKKDPVEYIIYKSINSPARFQYQVDYQTGKNPGFVALSDSMYEEECGFDNISFAHLHFHNII